MPLFWSMMPLDGSTARPATHLGYGRRRGGGGDREKEKKNLTGKPSPPMTRNLILNRGASGPNENNLPPLSLQVSRTSTGRHYPLVHIDIGLVRRRRVLHMFSPNWSTSESRSPTRILLSPVAKSRLASQQAQAAVVSAQAYTLIQCTTLYNSNVCYVYGGCGWPSHSHCVRVRDPS